MDPPLLTRSLFFLFAALVQFGLAPALVQAQNPPADAGQAAIGTDILWLIDGTSRLDVEAVADLPGAFRQGTSDQLKFGRSGRPVWLKIPPEALSAVPDARYLNLGHLISGGSLLVQRIDLYERRGGRWVPTQSWGMASQAGYPTGFREPVFRLDGPLAPRLIHIQPYEGKAVTIRALLLTEAAAAAKAGKDGLWIGLTLGFLLFAAGVAIAIFLLAGDRSFRAFAGFSAVMAGYYWLADLQGPAAWRALLDPQMWVLEPLLLAAAAVFGLVFVCDFLRLSEVSPQWDKAARLLIVITVAIPALSYLAQLPDLAGRTSMMAFIALPLFVLAATLRCWQRGSLAAVFMVLAAGVFVVAVLLHGLGDLLKWPVGPLLANLPRIGVVMFCALLVVTLGASGLEVLKQRGRDKAALEAAVAHRTDELVAARNRARDADAAKTRFLANISHEIRTPLNGILGVVEGLMASGLNPRQRQSTETIRHSSNLLLTLLDDLLDYSAIETGRITLRRQPFNPRDFIDETGRLWQASAHNKQITFVVDNRLGRGLVCEGDPARLRQILNNLLSNAIKFTDSGTVTLIATVLDEQDGQVRLRISVADTGVGISDEALARLFEPFEQGDPDTARRYGGSGLGLAISRRLAQAMGGDIEIESELGRGTRACLAVTLPSVNELLPLNEVEAADAAAQQAEAPSAGRTRLKILAVEDNALNRAVIETYLPMPEFHVHFAGLGCEAVDLVGLRDFDVILMDLRLPDIDGLEATRRIRQLFGPSAKVPIIVLTADSSDERRDAAQKAGADRFLEKPVDRDALVRAVRLLGQSAQAPEQGVA